MRLFLALWSSSGRAVAYPRAEGQALQPMPPLPPVTSTVRPVIGPLWICSISMLLRQMPELISAPGPAPDGLTLADAAALRARLYGG
jgi:hypothetical protein